MSKETHNTDWCSKSEVTLGDRLDMIQGETNPLTAHATAELLCGAFNYLVSVKHSRRFAAHSCVLKTLKEYNLETGEKGAYECIFITESHDYILMDDCDKTNISELVKIVNDCISCVITKNKSEIKTKHGEFNGANTKWHSMKTTLVVSIFDK